MFKTIAESVSAEIVEKKSRFIGNVYYVESVKEAEEIIKMTNKNFFDSRHNCYAFRIMTENGMTERFSDDGEPSGTAGAPMLNVLASQNLSNVLVIVTRYFGGILLGTGGLVKAYTTATVEALNQAEVVQKAWGKEVKLVVNYGDLEKLRYYLKQNDVRICHIEYGENVNVMAEMMAEKLDDMLGKREDLNFKILQCEVLQEKWIVV